MQSTGHRSNPQVRIGQHPEKFFDDNDYNCNQNDPMLNEGNGEMFVDDDNGNEEESDEDDEEQSRTLNDESSF